MEKYVKEFSLTQTPEKTFRQIDQLLYPEGYDSTYQDDEVTFRKGDGSWRPSSFVKLSCHDGVVRLEAWVEEMVSEQGLDGAAGRAAKKSQEKLIAKIESTLSRMKEESTQTEEGKTPGYVKEFSSVAVLKNAYPRIDLLMYSKNFQADYRMDEVTYRKGAGSWRPASFVKLSCQDGVVRLEAWVEAMDSEQGLDGITAKTVQKSLNKLVAQIEQMLCCAENQAANLCGSCGGELREGASFCPHCGNPVEVTVDFAQLSPIRNGVSADWNVSKGEYLRKYADKDFYRAINGVAICGYLMCGLMGLSALSDPWMLLDAAVLLLLLLGMHIGKSKWCAIAIAVDAAISTFGGLLLAGELKGWLWLIVGIAGAVTIYKAEKKYRGK